jgi:4-carboxymuconolactone decarboxylase
MTYSDRYQRGRAVLASMNNDPDGMAAWARLGAVGADLDRLLGEFCFGDVWAGDDLDKRTRRIITLTTVAVLGRMPMLESHVRGALEQGFTRQEILAVFKHLIPYAGFPVCLSSALAAERVFDEIDAREKEAS